MSVFYDTYAATFYRGFGNRLWGFNKTSIAALVTFGLLDGRIQEIW